MNAVDHIADGIGADIDVIALGALEGGGAFNQTRVALGVVDADGEVVADERDLVGGGARGDVGLAVVIGEDAGRAANAGAVFLIDCGRHAAAFVAEPHQVAGGGGATGQIPGVAGAGVHGGLDHGAVGALAHRHVLI
ncbi:hypothetical protein D3C71_1622930 [compost metagenome]